MSAMVEHRLRSAPVEVEWAGWRSDTHRLQASGWDLSVEFDPAYGEHRYRLALRHEKGGFYALSNPSILRSHYERYNPAPVRGPTFTIVHMAPHIKVISVPSDCSAFEPIDATPQWQEYKAQSLADLNIFAPASRADQVLVDKADMSVIEHLEAIKAKQSEKQRELRARVLDARAVAGAPRLHIVAQLVNYQDAA